ncbi:DUF4189 domain-containing protein [Acinetobacter dispersus]|uniref:DUF4189 domain-containing protein n=1 Tax=Acinetobacter dispersus TaxID=70348 RepID=UPI0002CFC26D|nr:DUF4189 domain-containing protein [Acinetobacter dispersus]ENX52033.1 hypothetical protein F901_03221 [Acinetobacter dispersus]MCH7393729.1 DUF4189 domain-containing protein [Acinetobacter dispersus]
MKKYIKHLIGLVVLLGLSCSVYAEGGCPNGMTPVNNGQNWTCISGGNDTPLQQEQTPLPPPKPTGYWLKTWGAIASDEYTGDAGTITGKSKKQEAETEALKRCSKVGSRNCRILLTYENQCAASAWGSGYMVSVSAPSIEQAESLALKGCSRKSSECKIVYSDCTKPEFIQY